MKIPGHFSVEINSQTFDRLLEQLAERPACRLMVDLLALAHDRGCEAELASVLASDLDAGAMPDMAVLRARFAPIPRGFPTLSSI